MDSSHLTHPQKRTKIKCIVLGAAGAGKTSLVRRYFRGTFEVGSRVPTLGSDFYTGRIRSPLQPEEKKDEHNGSLVNDKPFINLQVWDTAGRERKAKYTAALSDDFFRYADAAMLVYDATSSTSFTQLLRWHSDLMERMKNLDKALQRKRPFPVLIVANKMDIIEERERQNRRPERYGRLVPQRNVMGVHGDFKGKDSRYEYHVGPSKEDEHTGSPRRAKEVASTYMATHGEWTTDGSYLDSVLNSEDRLHPDRDMVLLWCMRNGLVHIEASALDGTGVDKAMDAMVSLALEYKVEKEQPPKAIEQQFQKEDVLQFQVNKELDLLQRYAPKERSCWSFPFCK